ncbi:LCP family protein [Cellulomonas sp. DKR-3]|uniref:LCP family protein n=1 Tax=Cellulomonas fulva TaxID=2835530 RepID=A0ABS5TXD3_9CELL|nr:LCP family protein [Cellulomonas fulva]MBT0993818.1 LCP family protein [Cellulomonas fulva]
MTRPRPARDLQERHRRVGRPTNPRHARTEGAAGRTWRVAALVALTAVALAASTAGAVVLRLRTSVDVADTARFLDGPRPTVAGATGAVDPTDGFDGRAVNLLVVGTDMRDGENADIGGTVGGMHNDTTMVVHVSADRSRVDVVSIPRDSLVDIPSCRRADGTRSAAAPHHIFNDALAFGGGPQEDLAAGAACVITTVEQATDVRIDASVVVKMDGVSAVIDELQGVDLCLPERMESKKAGHLVLDQGWNHLDGRTAIQFLRARSGTGNGLELGSDLARIGRQQQLIDALTAKIRSDELLADPVALLRVLDAVARSLSVSPELADPRTILGLAYSLRDLDVVGRQMVPVVDAPDGNRVLWTQEADDLWARIRSDEPITDEPAQPTTGSTAETTDRPTNDRRATDRPTTEVPASAAPTAPGRTRPAPPTTAPTCGPEGHR